MTDNWEPAFPVVETDGAISPGMTLRDWFAGQALAGLCAEQNGGNGWTSAEMASDSYLIADAMLKARKDSK